MKTLVTAFVTLVLVGAGCASNPPPRPDAALDAVRAEIVALKADAAGAGTCHERMHAVGQRAFATYGISALDVGDEWCNAGYIHGVIETALAGAEDPVAMMGELCDAFPASSFSGWECHHGTGHGLMYYTDNDLPRSVALCESVPGDASACINGVWMENFVAEEELHATGWRRDDDSFYPCDANVADGTADCYLYAPVWYLERHGHDYAAAFEWCAGAGGFVSSCARGVGAQAMKDNVADPESAAAICETAEDDLREDCVAGMAGILAFHHAALAPAEEWCERREGNDRVACEAEIRALQGWF